jgi:hypothetical protein
MARSTADIDTLYELEKEIFKLQMRAKDIEVVLDDNFDHLQDNFYKMSWKSIFSGRRKRKKKQQEEEETGYNTGFIQGLLGTESIQLLLQQLVPVVAAKISALLERLVERWAGKK